jgi:hypothetical protein
MKTKILIAALIAALVGIVAVPAYVNSAQAGGVHCTSYTVNGTTFTNCY